MEEKEKTETKLTYEQLENAAMQLQQRLIIAENKIRNIDFTAMRLNWLFKVLENKYSFEDKFLNKCSKEIEDILTLEETEEIKEEK